MPKNTQLSNTAANAKANALARLLDNGYIRVYDGTKPANANTAVGAQVLLAELRHNATSAPAAVAGLLTYNAITQDTAANAGGSATWFREFQSDGTTVVKDGTVGTTDANMIVPSTTVVAGVPFEITTMTHQEALSATGL